MLIDATSSCQALDESSRVRRLESRRHIAWWIGFVFVPGRPAGDDSVAYFLDHVSQVDLRQAVQILKGIFFFVLRDRASGTTHAFVDNSGLFKAYRGPKRISSSFLQLISSERIKWSDISPEAIVEFIQFGNIHFGNTFVPGIRKIGSDQICTFDRSGEITILAKALIDLHEAPSDNLEVQFQKLAQSFRYEKLSVDLTGGLDSRLISCLFAQCGLTFETAVSGTPDHPDLRIAAEVSRVLGVPFHAYHHQPGVNSESLQTLFEVVDGISDMLRYHRLLQYQLWRRGRGNSLSISGMGGELFRDFWWLQDFPFYGRKSANLKRLYRLRICPRPAPNWMLGSKYRSALNSLEEMMLNGLKNYLDVTNARTYDRIYYFIRMQEVAGCLSCNSLRLGLPHYSPLLDRECVRVGVNLPIRLRAFSGFHRAVITARCPAVSSIVTTGGATARRTVVGLPAGVWGYANNAIKRFLKKLSQRAGGPMMFMPVNPDNPLFLSYVLRSPDLRGDIQNLQSLGVLDPGVGIDVIRPEYLGRLMTVARLARYLSGT